MVAKMNKKLASFSSFQRFSMTEKISLMVEKENKLVLLADPDITKFDVFALFHKIGISLMRVNSIKYKPEMRTFKSKQYKSKAFKKFFIQFSKETNAKKFLEELIAGNYSVIV